jgi:phosphonate transport system substrate-binding protein
LAQATSKELRKEKQMIRKLFITVIGLLLATVPTITSLHNAPHVSAKGQPVFLYLAYNETGASYSDYFAAARQLGEMLEERIGRKVVVKVPHGDPIRSNEQVVESFQKGKADIAGLQLFAYLVAHESANTEIVANSTYNGEPTYFAQFLAHDQTGFDELSDLDSINLCWVDPLSVSGYIVPSLMLKAEGVTEGSESWYVGNHVEVVRLIYQRDCEAGAAYVDAREPLLAELPDVYNIVQVIEVSPPIPNLYGFSVAESVSPDLRVSIGAALTEISLDEDGALLLQILGAQNLNQVDHSIFAGLESLIADTGMTPQDVWETYFH